METSCDISFNHRPYADLETSSEEYAQRFRGALGEWLLNSQSSIVKEIYLSGKRGMVLDVGGGHGQIARCLASNGGEITVLGSTSEADLGIRELIQSGRCRFEVADLLAIPHGDRSYDTVTCFRLISHCDEWRLLIKELCRISKHQVIVDYPTYLSLNIFSRALFGLKRKIEKNTRQFTLFGHSEIRSEFERNGFSIVRRQGQFVLPMALHRWLDAPQLSRSIERLLSPLRSLIGTPVIIEAQRKA